MWNSFAVVLVLVAFYLGQKWISLHEDLTPEDLRRIEYLLELRQIASYNFTKLIEPQKKIFFESLNTAICTAVSQQVSATNVNCQKLEMLPDSQQSVIMEILPLLAVATVKSKMENAVKKSDETDDDLEQLVYFTSDWGFQQVLIDYDASLYILVQLFLEVYPTKNRTFAEGLAIFNELRHGKRPMTLFSFGQILASKQSIKHSMVTNFLKETEFKVDTMLREKAMLDKIITSIHFDTEDAQLVKWFQLFRRLYTHIYV